MVRVRVRGVLAENTRLTKGIDFVDRSLEESDNEEKFLVQETMEELMIESYTKSQVST